VDFPHTEQVMRIERVTTNLRGEPLRTDVAYAVTSLTAPKATPARLLHLSRGHWGIENSLHWVRDVTFDEDRSQIRTKNAPRVMATLRNLAVSLLRLAGQTNIARALRHYGARPHLTLALVGL
jgi:hypothetical protein